VTIGIRVAKGVIPDVSVLIQRLRVGDVGVWQGTGLADLLACEWIYNSAGELIR
jgi:hypothetical protein